MTVISTKQGDVDLDAVAEAPNVESSIAYEKTPDRPFTTNRVTGELTFRDHKGVERKLKPTFEALMEIEDALGIGVEALRSLFSGSGLPGLPAPTTRQYGAVLAAGLKAAGEQRATAEAASKFAYDIGRQRLRPVLIEFLWCLCDGGRGRVDDLGKGGSSSASLDGADETAASLIAELESRSANSSA